MSAPGAGSCQWGERRARGHADHRGGGPGRHLRETSRRPVLKLLHGGAGEVAALLRSRRWLRLATRVLVN